MLLLLYLIAIYVLKSEMRVMNHDTNFFPFLQQIISFCQLGIITSARRIMISTCKGSFLPPLYNPPSRSPSLNHLSTPHNTHKSKHLPIPHLNRQENHNKSRQPNPARTKPQDTTTTTRKVLRTSERGNDTSQSSQTR